MTYDSLINQLAADLKPVRRRRVSIDIAVVLAICATELALFFALGAARPDMPLMMKQPVFQWRLVSLGLIALTSGGFAVLSFNPIYSPKQSLRWISLIIMLCIAFGLCIIAGPHGVAAVIHRLSWTNGVQCTGKIVALSIPCLIGLGVLMRRGAPTDVRATALLIGVAAAAWGAFIFVFACPFSDALYVAVWYSVGCAIVTVLSRLILPRLTRW